MKYIIMCNAEDNFKQKYDYKGSLERALAEAERDKEGVKIYKLVAEVNPENFRVTEIGGE